MVTIDATWVLWLVLLVLVVQFLIPGPAWKWGKLVIWFSAVLVSVVLVLVHFLVMR